MRTTNTVNAAATIVVLITVLATAASSNAAVVDLDAGTLLYWDDTLVEPGVANDVEIALVDGWYTIDDPAETSVTPTAAARAAGCAPYAATTVTCPAAAVTALVIATRLGDDHVVLRAAADPALVTGGPGDDTLVGGDGDDVFLWNPGDGNDAIDGGPGSDTLSFNGSDTGERAVVVPRGDGFDLVRGTAEVHLRAQRTETVTSRTADGAAATSNERILP